MYAVAYSPTLRLSNRHSAAGTQRKAGIAAESGTTVEPI
jgi:hypothetical protein